VQHDTVDEIVTTLFTLGGREDEPATRTYALFPILRAEVKLEPMQMPTVEEQADAPKPKKTAAKKSVKSQKSAVAASFNITEALKERLTELRRRGYNRLYQQAPGGENKI